MPPRRKVQKTPEEIAQMFVAWKESDEAKLVSELREKKPEPMTDLRGDLLKRWTDYMVEFHKLPGIFKIRGAKMKPPNQAELRTIFFAAAGTDLEKCKDEDFVMDGEKYMYEFKTDPKNAWHTRRNFVAIIRALDDAERFHPDTFFDDYNEWKKTKLTASYKEYVKLFKIHLKKEMRQGRTKKTSGYMESEDLIERILNNFRLLLESNYALSQFEFNYKSEEDRAINDFKYKALLKKFYDCYKTCQTTVYNHSCITIEREGDADLREKAIYNDPDLASVLKKFDYKRWRENHIEHFFINPLHTAYLRMRANLIKVYTMGRDFWRFPIEENKTFIRNVIEMVTCENLAEIMLGTELKRDQLNFAYRTLEYLYLNETKEMLLEKTKGIMERVIPQLMIARTLDQMATISERKYQDSKKPKSERPVIFKAHVNPAISRAIDIVTIPDLTTSPEQLKKEEEEAYELAVYGRFNLWPDYMDELHQKKLIQASEVMRTVNPAVRKDVEDYLILQGISPDLEEFAAFKRTFAFFSKTKHILRRSLEFLLWLSREIARDPKKGQKMDRGRQRTRG